MKISDNNKILHPSEQWRTCYGKKIISLIKNGKYIWKIKSIGSSHYFTYIGIDNANAIYIDDNFSNSGYKAMYAYNLRTSLYSWNKSSVWGLPKLKNKGDILTMKLEFIDNLSDGILSIKINDTEEVIATKYVTREKGLNYRLAIASAESKACYQIIN